jgi:hypothetical protein
VRTTRCDNCGAYIPGSQAVKSTRDEQIGPANLLGAKTVTIRIRLCPACAKKRTTALRIALGIAFGVVLLLVLEWLLRR